MVELNEEIESRAFLSEDLLESLDLEGTDPGYFVVRLSCDYSVRKQCKRWRGYRTGCVVAIRIYEVCCYILYRRDCLVIG